MSNSEFLGSARVALRLNGKPWREEAFVASDYATSSSEGASELSVPLLIVKVVVEAAKV